MLDDIDSDGVKDFGELKGTHKYSDSGIRTQKVVDDGTNVTTYDYNLVGSTITYL